jgi:cyclophilin family peptidyl-prolyl cis-trans isomerase
MAVRSIPLISRGLLALAAGLALATSAQAQNPRVWLDTSRGPIFIELDEEKAPVTTAHILNLADQGYYQDLIFHRSSKNAFVQGGGYGLDGRHKVSNDTVASERANGLKNLPGTVALVVPEVGGVPQFNSGTTQFIINVGTNTFRDGVYTVFGKVVYGMPVVTAINNIATIPFSSAAPRAPTLMHRMVEIQGEGFPIMPLHTAAWYDPDNAFRGISVEVTTASGEPTLVVYWYDYLDGAQVWMTGAVPFAYGATEATVPLAITEGEELLDAGTMTVRFSDCDHGSFSYDTPMGSGVMELQRLTVADGVSCPAN